MQQTERRPHRRPSPPRMSPGGKGSRPHLSHPATKAGGSLPFCRPSLPVVSPPFQGLELLGERPRMDAFISHFVTLQTLTEAEDREQSEHRHGAGPRGDRGDSWAVVKSFIDFISKTHIAPLCFFQSFKELINRPMSSPGKRSLWGKQ